MANSTSGEGTINVSKPVQIPAWVLALAFAGGGGFSRGTLKTMVLGGKGGGAIRRAGRIVPVPTAWKSQRIAFQIGRAHV